MSYLDPNVVTKLEKERRLKAAQKETKVAKTISIPISYWALLDQVRNKGRTRTKVKGCTKGN